MSQKPGSNNNSDDWRPRIILGSGRSGTTWILDSLAEANQLRPVFEPLHPSESGTSARYAYELLEAGQREDELLGYFRDLSEGKRHSNWIDYRAPSGLLFPGARLFRIEGHWKRSILGWKKYLRARRTLKDAVRRKAVLLARKSTSPTMKTSGLRSSTFASAGRTCRRRTPNRST